MNIKSLFVKTITRRDGTPYLVRYTLLNLGIARIRLHHILQSDYDCLHDHPWAFISIILKGGYFEFTNKWDSGDWFVTKYLPRSYYEDCKYYGPGAVLLRPAKWKHRLELRHKFPGLIPAILANETPLISCWSLVIMGPRTRLWGFWTRNGFVPWFNYDSRQKCD
jgi:hypothetical protein